MKNNVCSTPILRRAALNFAAIAAVSAIFGAKAFESAHDAQAAGFSLETRPAPALTQAVLAPDAGKQTPFTD